uniref:Protein diaphanous (inferred by orthology to a D. melanogaster protein) n=1 Tax=Anisakis simplex TaxID=6269 RepID=A0A0M3KBY8_ANISI
LFDDEESTETDSQQPSHQPKNTHSTTSSSTKSDRKSTSTIFKRASFANLSRYFDKAVKYVESGDEDWSLLLRPIPAPRFMRRDSSSSRSTPHDCNSSNSKVSSSPHHRCSQHFLNRRLALTQLSRKGNYAMGKLSDAFLYKLKHPTTHEPSCASQSLYSRSSTTSLDQEPVGRMTDEQVNDAFRKIARKLQKQMNIKGEKLEALVADRDIAKKRQMVAQSQRLNMPGCDSSKSPNDFVNRMERALQAGEGHMSMLKDLLKDLKVHLSVQKVNYIKEFGDKGGIQLLFRIMENLMSMLRQTDCPERDEEGAILLYDSMKCLKSIVNTWPGMYLCFKRDSKMFKCLVGALSVAACKPTLDCWYSLRFETLNLLTVVAFINDDQFELQGRDILLEELSKEGRNMKCERFWCIVSCLKKTNRLDVVKKALMLVNIILDVRDPDDVSTDEGKAAAEEAWQMRMHWRSEFMRAGMYQCVDVRWRLIFRIRSFKSIHLSSTFLEHCTAESIKAQYDTFCHNKEADFAELVERFEQIPNYFRLIENCISEIVLPKTCVDPDFRGKFEFTQDVCQIVG